MESQTSQLKVGKKFTKEIIGGLKRDSIGVIPTDTIYGLVGSALSRKAVQKIYRLRNRNPKKPMIVLISCVPDLKIFGIKLSASSNRLATNLWPGKVSIILPCSATKFKYLHRGTNQLAFRIPKSKKLRDLLKKTGPLVAPSANKEGRPPARTIRDAQKYFSNKVDFYINFGRLNSKPSRLVKIEDGQVIELRK